MENKKKIVVVGTGIIGIEHIKAIEASEHFTLCALCDVNKEKVSALAEEYNVPYFTDYHEIPSSLNADAVILNLPHFLHCESTVFFLNNGYNVLVEKPMANSVKECDEMIDAANRNNKILAVGHVQRFFNANRKVKEIVDSGKLGKLCMFTEVRTTDYFTQARPKWFLSKKTAGGGIVMNYGAHALDKLCYITGKLPDQVNASCGNCKNEYDIEGHAQFMLKYPDGLSACVTFSAYSLSDYDTVYYFTNGALKVSDSRLLSYSTDGTWCPVDVDEDGKYMERQLEEFYNLLSGKTADIADALYSKNIIRIIEQIYQ